MYVKNIILATWYFLYIYKKTKTISNNYTYTEKGKIIITVS